MAGEKRDFYEVLGVPKGADDSAIKKAYRKMAKENHPDLHPGDVAAEARFKEINEAYEVLSDEGSRAKYDQFGHAGVDPNFGGGGGFGGGFEDLDLGDILGSMFGGGFGGGRVNRNGPQKGESLRAAVTITFEESAFGCEKELLLGRTETCKDCSGSGAAAGTTPETCPDCRGQGVVQMRRGSGMFSMMQTVECNRCRGRGKLIHSPCSVCNGAGSQRKQQRIRVNIPAGIADGQSISMRGQGNAGRNGGPAGDLLVRIGVSPHAFFRREGNHVVLEKEVSFIQATLGDQLKIPTIDGEVQYDLPEGTPTGTTFRLRSKGMPDVNGRGRGDQYVTVKVGIPRNLTGEQKASLKAFGEAMGMAEPTPKSFFDKRKKKK